MKIGRSHPRFDLQGALTLQRGEDEGAMMVSGATAGPTRRTGFKTLDRVGGMLLGCAIGDALGMPIEGIDNEQTLKALARLGGIKDFLAPQPHVLRSLRPLRAGCWTDDTQLTLAISDCLAEQRRLDYDAIARAHVRAFETLELRGWDATTKQACRRLAQGTVRTRSGKLGGNGNAVAVKISPVAAWSFLRGETREELLAHCTAIGQMTHMDPRAITGAYLIGQLVRDALAAPKKWEPSAERYDELIEEAEWAESVLSRTLGHSDDPISRNLSELSDALDADPAELAELSNGATSYVCHSVPFVVALLCGRAWEFEEGVLAAVNVGGDADSNGAMVGAVLGAAYGLRRIPKRLADKVEEVEILRDAGTRFGQLFEL